MHLLKVSSFLRRSAQFRKLYTASRQVLPISNSNKNLELVTGTQIQQCAYGSSLVFQRNSSKVAAKFENGEEQTRISDALHADELIDRIMSKMETDVKRVGHVLRKDVDSVFGWIKTSGTVSSIQSLYLIRCGSLLYFEPLTHRTAAINEIWDKLQELGIPLDASHYNALLKCYIENEYQFSPAEFLATMEQKGIAPNRVTYQRIIEKYCHDGDLSGASAILEHMKERGLPINENIFNSLVLGHARANDMKGAANMLDVMRQSQLDPSSETYTALACGFAENGDMEGFGNTLHEAEEKGLCFDEKNYLKMVSSSAVSGNLEYINELLTKIEIREYRAEVTNTALGLINKGLNDAACRIAVSLFNAGYSRMFYAFAKAIVVKENSVQRIVDFCKKIYNEGIHEYIYEDGAKACIIHAKPEDAFYFFKEMKDVGRVVRCHYFWPIFSSFAKTGDTEGMWAALKCMSDLALPADLDTYIDYILPHMSTSDPEAIISKIKEFGQSEAVFTDALFLYFCTSGQLSAAANMYKEYKPQCSFISLAIALSNIPLKDVAPAVTLLKQTRNSVPDPDASDDVCGEFLKYLHKRKLIPILSAFIEEYNIQGIKLPTPTVQELCSQLKTVAPELVRLVQNLEINVILHQHVNEDYIRPSTMSLEELEKHLIHLKETGGNVRPVLRQLLSNYCQQKDLEHALEIKAELDAIDFTYSPASYAMLVNLFVSFNNLEEAMKYKKLIDEQYPHVKLDAAKAVSYVTLMFKNDKVDEALDIIKTEARDWLKPRYEDLLVKSVKDLLHAVADTGNVDLTRQLFEIFAMDLKFLPLHHTSLEPLVKVHLVRNDVDGAIEEYRNCVVNYNAFPSRNFLFRKFITAKDPEHLQTVVDISTTYGGKEIPLHELAAAFIDCGCVAEARKVIQTLGAKVDPRQLEIICYRFFKQEKVMELEQLISITKDLYSIDRDQLYAHLLNLYVNTNDYQAALEMWNSIQEENVQPSVNTLQQLAALLEKNDQPVPFVVPLRTDVQNTTDLMNCLDTKREVETVEILKRMRKGEVHALTPDTFTRIVDLLTEKKNLRDIVSIVQVMSCILSKPAQVLKPIANKYGQAGDVNSMKLLFDCFPDFAHKYMHFNTNFFEAYVVSGQEEKLLNELEKNIETARHLFSPRGFLRLLQSRPDLFDRAMELADMYVEKENYDQPKMVLWLHQFLQENYEVAEEMYKKNSDPILRSSFPIVNIIQTVRSTQNEIMGRKLIDLVNNALMVRVKPHAYSCFLDVLVQSGKLNEAVALIEEASKNDVPTEKLLQPTLRNLKNSLVERNMPVPFQIPSEDEGSGSGSSSDSD